MKNTSENEKTQHPSPLPLLKNLLCSLVATCVLLLTGLLVITSCENYQFLDEEAKEEQTPKSTFRVVTRSNNDEEIAYPLRIYAFSADGTLREQKTVNSESENILLTLNQGEAYKLVAVSGSSNNFSIPQNPRTSDVISLTAPNNADENPEGAGGYCISQPLLLGFADIMPTNSPTATCHIQLLHQMCSLEINLNNIPESSKTVLVNIASPYTGINFNGTYVGSSTTRISLIKTSAGKWMSTKHFVFPTNPSHTTFTISCKDDNDETISSVTYQSTLHAGTPYILNGTYQDGAFSVSTNISAPEWGEAVQLDFNFGQNLNTVIPANGNQGENPGNPGGGNEQRPDGTTQSVSSIPLPYTLWNDHIVAAVLDSKDEMLQAPITTSEATLLLMSKKDWSDMTSYYNTSSSTTAYDQALIYSENELDEWDIPTAEEARILHKAYNTMDDDGETATSQLGALIYACQADPVVIWDSKGNRVRYLCEYAEKTFSFDINSITKAGATVKNYHMRLVKRIKVKVEK